MKAHQRHKATCQLALAHGFVYKPMNELAATAELSELLARLKAVGDVDGGSFTPANAEA